jgi:hypothetical protein
METTPNMNPLKNMGSFIPKKTIIIGLMTIFGLIFFLVINPFSWNDAGNRTVVERTTGEQIVQFAPGIFLCRLLCQRKRMA